MIIMQNLVFPLDATEDEIKKTAIRKLKLTQSQIKETFINRISIDARKKNAIKIVCSVGFQLQINESEFIEKNSNKNIKLKQPFEIKLPSAKKNNRSPIIVGFGPAGIFAALILSQFGYRPIVFEQGSKIDERITKIDEFIENRKLNTKSNIQFGEGGAGTFSDGKLTTRINDPRCDYVLKTFREFGANKDVLYRFNPHIGTDVLRRVIAKIRENIISNGGEIHFDSKVTKLLIRKNKVVGISANGENFYSDKVILAIGHSARDTFDMLYQNDVSMISKAFSVGVRIEQLQSTINRSMYGKHAGHPLLGNAEYRVFAKKSDRCTYSFCMCPGGTVVPATSEEGCVVTNGMSLYARNSGIANSAIVVSVDNRDFGENIFGGIDFQRKLEQKSFLAGGSDYSAPIQDCTNFINGISGINRSTIVPSYKPSVKEADLAEIFPEEITAALRFGLVSFGNQIENFTANGAVLTGTETRTSSPIRILRNTQTLQSQSIDGLFPCGEGAGYAGGIISAAVDGIRAAEAIVM